MMRLAPAQGDVKLRAGWGRLDRDGGPHLHHLGTSAEQACLGPLDNRAHVGTRQGEDKAEEQ